MCAPVRWPRPVRPARRGRIELRLGDGLSVLRPGEARDIVIAGMGAETIIEILAAAPWVFNPAYNLVLVPATKHSILRRWLAQSGFALAAETLCTAAGRWYAVMDARWSGQKWGPDGYWCVCGLTGPQPGADAYRAQQLVKIKKYRRGLPPGPDAAAVDRLIEQLEETP